MAALNARNPFEAEHATPSLHRYRTGAALGGPIVKDRTFFYAAIEQEHNRSLEHSFITPASAAGVRQIRGTSAEFFRRMEGLRARSNQMRLPEGCQKICY